MIGKKARSVGLRVKSIENDKSGRSECYIDQNVVEKLQLLTGSIIEIQGNKRTTGIVIPSIPDKGKNIIRLNNLQLLNAGAKVGDFIRINEASVFPAEEIELTPTGSVTGLITQKEVLKSNLINKPIVEGDIIDVLVGLHQKNDPRDPVRHILKLLPKPHNNRNLDRSMRMVVEKTQPSNKVVKVTRDTKIKVKNKRGKIEFYEYPASISKDDNGYKKVIEDLLTYTRKLEERIRNLDIEKQVLNLEGKKLEYGKRILNNAIERLTNITCKLLESPLLSNARYEYFKSKKKERETSDFKDLEELSINLTKLERIVSDKSSEENTHNTGYCKYCGGEVEENQVFCRHCGTRVN